MKFLKTTALLALAALMAVGCQTPIQTPGQITPNEEVGYLHLGGLSVELIADHQQTDNGVTRAAATREGELNIDNFDCYILDQSGQNVISTFKYGARPSEKITLEAGKYIFKMISGEIPAAAWENPVYGVSEVFTIVRKQTTELKDLVCTLQNIQATISYSADLRAALSDDTVATLSVGGASLDFVMDETRSGYFKAVNALNDINVLIKGKYAQEGKEAADFEFTTTIKDVKAGQYSDIQLYIEYSGEGNIAISVTIDGWIVDQNIEFDFKQIIAEDTLVDDSDKPTITLIDGNIDEQILLAASDFNENGDCTKSIAVEIATKGAIASAAVEINSTNSDMMASLADYNLTNSFDLCNASAGAAAIMRLMGLPVNGTILGKASVVYNITKAMALLKDFVGTHSFQVTVTDDKGGKSTKTLTIVIKGSEAITFDWIGGYSIDKQYVVDSNLTVNITVNAEAGIKDFVVTIISTNDMLSPASLTDINLCDILNLVTPTASMSSVNPSFDTSNMAVQITNLGFPVGDEVKNQTSVQLVIATNFLSLLSGVNGEHKFVMEVTDNDGNTVTKSLMLKSI